MLRTVVFALTLNPSPKMGEGLLSGSPSPKFGKRGWGKGFFFSSGKNYSFPDGRGLNIFIIFSFPANHTKIGINF
jgi:hypothetical protein